MAEVPGVLGDHVAVHPAHGQGAPALVLEGLIQRHRGRGLAAQLPLRFQPGQIGLGLYTAGTATTGDWSAYQADWVRR